MLVQPKPTTSSGQSRAGGGSRSSGGTGTTTGSETMTRKNQSALSSKEWDTLISAMQKLKKDKGSRNWDYFTELHKTYGEHDDTKDHQELPHLSGDDLTIHSSMYWLPWHRKFILEFEERLRDFEPDVTIPYWNWVSSRCIPEEFGKKVFGWMHVARAVFHNGDKLPTAGDYAKVTGASSYSTLDLQLVDLHNVVHNWVGGEMANAKKSPNDPVFFLHHAFIDKTWHDWATAHANLAFPAEYLDFELPPWSTKVRDVLAIDDLGYGYR